MKRNEVYSKFKACDGIIHYFSMEEIHNIGNPIDEDGIDMELVDDDVYTWQEGPREWQYLPL